MRGIQDLYPEPGIIRAYTSGGQKFGIMPWEQPEIPADIAQIAEGINWKQVVIAFFVGYFLGGRK